MDAITGTIHLTGKKWIKGESKSAGGFPWMTSQFTDVDMVMALRLDNERRVKKKAGVRRLTAEAHK